MTESLRIPYHRVTTIFREGFGWSTEEEVLDEPLQAEIPDAWVTEDGEGFTWMGCDDWLHSGCPTCNSPEPCIQDITVRRNGEVLVIHDAELRGLA